MLYTKPGCCLCDGLRETLEVVMRGDSGVAVSPELASLGGGVETRDVSTNDAWAARHAMEVPVLALSFRAEGEGDGEEEEEEEVELPRPSPRLAPARLAIRLSADVARAMKKKGGGATSASSGTDDEEKKKPGGGWAVVSERPF